MTVLLVVGFAVSSVGNLLTGLAWSVAVAFALQTVRGLGIAAMDVASNTLLQRLVPDHLLGPGVRQPLRRDRRGRRALLPRRWRAARRDERALHLRGRGHRRSAS
jgi:MFS family permease